MPRSTSRKQMQSVSTLAHTATDDSSSRASTGVVQVNPPGCCTSHTPDSHTRCTRLSPAVSTLAPQLPSSTCQAPLQAHSPALQATPALQSAKRGTTSAETHSLRQPAVPAACANAAAGSHTPERWTRLIACPCCPARQQLVTAGYAADPCAQPTAQPVHTQSCVAQAAFEAMPGCVCVRLRTCWQEARHEAVHCGICTLMRIRCSPDP